MDCPLSSTPIQKTRDPASVKLLKSQLKDYSLLLQEKKINKIKFEGEIRNKIVEEIKESGILAKNSEVIDNDFDNALNRTRGEIIRLVESVRQPETDKAPNQILEANLKKCEEEMDEVKRKLSLTEFELFEMKMTRKSQVCSEPFPQRILLQLEQLRKENKENREFVANLLNSFATFKDALMIPNIAEDILHKMSVVKSHQKVENCQNIPESQFSYRSEDIFSSRVEMEMDLGEKPETIAENSQIPLFNRIRDNSGIYSAGKFNRNDSGTLFYTAGTSHNPIIGLQNMSCMSPIIKDSKIIQERGEETETNYGKNDVLDKPNLVQPLCDSSTICSAVKPPIIDSIVLPFELQDASCLWPIVEDARIAHESQSDKTGKDGNDSLNDHSPVFVSKTRNFGQTLSPSCDFMAKKTFFEQLTSPKPSENEDICSIKSIEFDVINDMVVKSNTPSVHSPRVGDVFAGVQLSEISVPAGCQSEQCFDATIHPSNTPNVPTPSKSVKSLREMKMTTFPVHSPSYNISHETRENCAERHNALDSRISALSCDFETLKGRFDEFLLRYETEKKSPRDVEVSGKQNSLNTITGLCCSPKNDSARSHGSNQNSINRFRKSAHRLSLRKSTLYQNKVSFLDNTAPNPDLNPQNHGSVIFEPMESPTKSRDSRNRCTLMNIPLSALNSSEKTQKEPSFEDCTTENEIGSILKEARECAVSISSIGPCEEAVTTSLVTPYFEDLGQVIIDFSDAACNKLEEEIDDNSSGSTVMSRVKKRKRNAKLQSMFSSIMSPLKKQRKTGEEDAPKHKYKLRSNKYSDYVCTTSNLFPNTKNKSRKHK